MGGTMAAKPIPPPDPNSTRSKTTAMKSAETVVSSNLQNGLRALLKKRWVRITGIVIGVLLLLLIALPFLINVNSFRPQIESQASTALGREVKLGDLSLSILSGTVGVDDIRIADDPAFSKSPFVTAKSLNVGVELMPLIFSKQLNVTKIALNGPQIMLLKAPNGTWNFSSLGGAANKAPASKPSTSSTPQNFSIGKLEVNDGKLTVGNVNSR